jgi:RecA-family ATPase
MKNHDIDIMQAFTTDPPKLEFIFPGGGLPGTVNLLTSPGGTGKSILAMQMSMGICCPDADLLGLTGNRDGKVLYLGLEDPPAVLHQRLHAVGKHLSPSAQRGVDTCLKLKGLMGSGFDIMNPEWRRYVIDSCDEITSLIVIDTLSRIHFLDENSNGQMAQLLTYLERIAVETNTAILLLHHSSKSMAVQGRGDEQQAARGASSLVDNARWQAYMSGMTKGEAKFFDVSEKRRGFYVRFGVSKQNYGSPFADRWYERHAAGMLLPAPLVEKRKGGERSAI